MSNGQIAMVEDIINVNYRYAVGYNSQRPPHPFVVGIKHMENSKGMYLEPDAAPCDHCGLPFNAHGSDRVIVVKLLRDCTKREMVEWMEDILESEYIKAQKQKVDGFIFLESEEGYRVLKDEDA